MTPTAIKAAVVALALVVGGCGVGRHAREFCAKQCADRGGVRKVAVSPLALRCDCLDDQPAAAPDTEPGR